MKAGRKSYEGTVKEKQQVQVRLLINEVEDVKKNKFFGFGDLSKYIVNLWSKDLAHRGVVEGGEK